MTKYKNKLSAAFVLGNLFLIATANVVAAGAPVAPH